MMLKRAIERGWRFRKIAFVVFLINALFGVFLGSQFYQIFKSARAGEWQYIGWTGHWDHALIQDFLHYYWDALAVIIWEVKLLIPLFFIIHVFVTAGVFYACTRRSDDFKVFWRGGSGLFMPFLINALTYLILFGLTATLTIVPGIWMAIDFLEHRGTEIGALYWVLFSGFVFVFLELYLINSSTVSKAYLVRGDGGWLSLTKGLSIGWHRWRSLMVLFFVFLLASLIMLAVVKLSQCFIGFRSWLGIFFVVAVQQFFVYLRSLFHLMYLLGVQSVVEEFEGVQDV